MKISKIISYNKNACQIGYGRYYNIFNSKWKKKDKHTLNSFLYNS
jgi:hypothetical protein